MNATYTINSIENREVEDGFLSYVDVHIVFTENQEIILECDQSVCGLPIDSQENLTVAIDTYVSQYRDDLVTQRQAVIGDVPADVSALVGQPNEL